MARPAHRPSPVQRRQVEVMAGHGVPETGIARTIGIDPKTLRKHYRRELDLGHVRANMKVAETLFRKATGDGRHAGTAAIFWMKARAGWRETARHELTGRDGRAIEFAAVTDAELEAHIARQARMLCTKLGGAHCPDEPPPATPDRLRLPPPSATPPSERRGHEKPPKEIEP